MSPKNRRLFTTEQKSDAVRIVEQSDKPISQIAKELAYGERCCNSPQSRFQENNTVRIREAAANSTPHRSIQSE
jgi:transposase-like protein